MEKENMVIGNVENSGKISGVINGAGWEVLTTKDHFDALKEINNEPKGTRHKPMQHHEALRMFCDKIADSEIRVKQFTGMLSPNKQKFIFMTSVSDDQISDLEFNLGFISFNDKSRALTTICGRTVFCCSNGVIRCDGDQEKRKHMKNVESGAYDIFSHSIDNFNKYRDEQMMKINKMKNIEVDDRMFADIVLGMHRSQVFGHDPAFIGKIVGEFCNPVPRHEEFGSKSTLWCLENAITEQYKSISPIKSIKIIDEFDNITGKYLQ